MASHMLCQGAYAQLYVTATTGVLIIDETGFPKKGARSCGVAAPGVRAESLLPGDERAEAAQVRGIRLDVGKTLHAHVLVGPQRPAGVVAIRDLQLVVE